MFCENRLVIMVLVDIANGKQRHVPYRDSKLSFLLQVWNLTFAWHPKSINLKTITAISSVKIKLYL
jgi:hypothetical protein